MSGHGAGDARSRILGRVREALEGRELAAHPGSPPGTAPSGGSAVRDFARAFRRAGGEAVLLADEAAATEWLEAFGRDVPSAACGSGVPAGLRPRAPSAPPAEAALGVSLALAAAADTGTLVLGSGEGRGVQLLPPTHLVWVRAADVHATLAGALERARGRGLPAALALHSGPSKSADIGRIVVTGVHGPGRVVAAVLGAGEEGV